MRINEHDLRRLYIDEMLTDEETATVLGCTKMGVYLARKRLGIKAYKRWQRNTCEPTARQIEIIYASLLGDGHISSGIKNGSPCQSIFEDKHRNSQKQYVFWKYNELKSLCCSAPRQLKNGQWRLRTFHHPFFSELRRKFYPDGVKIVDRNSLSQIGPLGLAVWLMDDGALSKSSNHLKFCTCSFTEQEHVLLSDWLLARFGIKSEMKVYSGYRVLVVCLESRKKLIDIVKNQVVNCLKYKTIFREFHTWENT